MNPQSLYLCSIKDGTRPACTVAICFDMRIFVSAESLCEREPDFYKSDFRFRLSTNIRIFALSHTAPCPPPTRPTRWAVGGWDLLRRDQIWFTEKDRTEATDLYSLMHIVLPDGSKPRGDGNLERNYIKGRYGAIPYLTPLK